MVKNRLIVLIFILLVMSVVTPLTGLVFGNNISKCMIYCPNNSKICKYITYDINGECKKKSMNKPCIFNGWNLLHILLYFTLTIVFPEYKYLLFLIGILWETLEIYFGVENWLDIVWNLLGIMLGLLVVYVRNKKKL